MYLGFERRRVSEKEKKQLDKKWLSHHRIISETKLLLRKIKIINEKSKNYLDFKSKRIRSKGFPLSIIVKIVIELVAIMRRRDKTTYAMSLHDRLAKKGVFAKSFTVCDFRSRFQTNFIFWMFRIILVYHPSMVKVARFGDQHRVYQRQNYMKISSSRNFFIYMTIQVINIYWISIISENDPTLTPKGHPMTI